MAMDVRNVTDAAPVVEHNGTVPVWWMVNPREMLEITDGGYLELVNEFEVPGGGEVVPALPPDPRVLLRDDRSGHHDHRGRGAGHRPGRPRPHPAGQGPQPSSGERPRTHPLLLLRHRLQGAGPIDYTTH